MSRRRFATPGDLLRAYASHQHTRASLKKLAEQAEDEQRALDREMAELLYRLPHGIHYQDRVYTDAGDAGSPRIRVTSAPVASYDLDTWADVQEWAQRAAEPNTIGPGPDAPSYTVPDADEEAEAVYAHADVFGMPSNNLDLYLPAVGLSLVGVEIKDDDGDDSL